MRIPVHAEIRFLFFLSAIYWHADHVTWQAELGSLDLDFLENKEKRNGSNTDNCLLYLGCVFVLHFKFLEKTRTIELS